MMLPVTSIAQARPNRPSYADIAFEAITERIFNRTLEPGAWIRIDGVAAELDMSITPVREALARTAAVGLARADANRGYRVAPLLDAEHFHNLFAARRAIEIASLRGSRRKSAAWIDETPDTDIAALQALVAKMRDVPPVDSYREYSQFSRLDNELHLRLVKMAGNDFLVGAWEGLHFHLHMSRLYGGFGIIDFDVAQSEHEALVDALADRDGAQLIRLADAHISKAEKRLTALLR